VSSGTPSILLVKGEGNITTYLIDLVVPCKVLIDQEAQVLIFCNLICGETSIGSKDGLMIIVYDFDELMNSRFATDHW
jgi:hypothetical protein